MRFNSKINPIFLWNEIITFIIPEKLTLTSMKFVFFILLFTLPIASFAQTNWDKIENDLSKKLEQKEININEWYAKRKSKAGHFGPFSLWVEEENSSKREKSLENVNLYFPKDFQIVAENGSKFARIYLENNTSDSLEIQRIDATLANVQEFFLVKGKWLAFRKNHTSTCGNSYFDSKLAPNHQLILSLDNDVLVEGRNAIKYKIGIMLGKRWVESNIITVHLHNSQLKRMLESRPEASKTR